MQLFSKLECDEVEMLEHTRELLEELGPEEAMASEESGKKEQEGLVEDSDSEHLEENDTQADTENMELS